MSREFIGARIKKGREEMGLSQDDLGKLYGTSGANLSRIESGQYDISSSDLQRMADIQGKPIEWYYSDNIESAYRPMEAVYAELGQSIKKQSIFREIPILCHVPCGYPMPNEQQAEGTVKVLKEDLDYHKDKPGLFALIASGDSLVGDKIYDGYRIIIDPDIGDHPDGLIYAVRVGNEVTCKHVRHTDGKVILYSSNHDYKEMVYPENEVELKGVAILWGIWKKAIK